MPDVLALVDMPPLRYPTRFGVNPADTKGRPALDLSFHVPMLKAVSVDQVGIAIKAAATGFAVALGPHTQFTDGIDQLRHRQQPAACHRHRPGSAVPRRAWRSIGRRISRRRTRPPPSSP